MSGGVVHALHTGLPGDGTSAVQFPDWDADHVIPDGAITGAMLAPGAVPVPPLSDVLVAGNDTGGNAIAGQGGYIDLSFGTASIGGAAGGPGQDGAQLTATAGTGSSGCTGGPANFSAGNSIDGGLGAALVLGGGTPSDDGRVHIRTAGSVGNPLDYLAADGSGGTTWQPLPSTAAMPTADEKAALDAAPTALTALNPVASVADLPAVPTAALHAYSIAMSVALG